VNGWNRKKILEFFKEELERCRRENQSTGLIMVDIDLFKRVNDNYGHFIGDRVLIEVGRRLKKSIRKYDKIGRYGGDEMLIVLPDCSQVNVKKIAERLRQGVSEEKIETGKVSLKVTISVGGTSSDISSLASGDDLIQISDLAMYSAKKKGRNCVVILDSLQKIEARN